jgi:hypothetical protein
MARWSTCGETGRCPPRDDHAFGADLLVKQPQRPRLGTSPKRRLPVPSTTGNVMSTNSSISPAASSGGYPHEQRAEQWRAEPSGPLVGWLFSMEEFGMRNHLIAALMSVTVTAPVMLSTEAMAQRNDGRYERSDQRQYGDRNGRNNRQWRGDQEARDWDPSSSYRNGNYRERRLSRNDRIYRGRDGRAYCKRSDGTTGLVIGAVGGGVLANLIGGVTLGTLAGAGGGALLGRSVDRGNVRCR